MNRWAIISSRAKESIPHFLVTLLSSRWGKVFKYLTLELFNTRCTHLCHSLPIYALVGNSLQVNLWEVRITQICCPKIRVTYQCEPVVDHRLWTGLEPVVNQLWTGCEPVGNWMWTGCEPVANQLWTIVNQLRTNVTHTVFPHIVSVETILFWIWKSKGRSTKGQSHST